MFVLKLSNIQSTMKLLVNYWTEWINCPILECGGIKVENNDEVYINLGCGCVNKPEDIAQHNRYRSLS